MHGLERKLEFLNIQAKFGHDRNHGYVKVTHTARNRACDSFRTGQDWILQFTAEDYVHWMIDDKVAFFYRRIGISDTLLYHGLLVLVIRDVTEDKFCEHVASRGSHRWLKHNHEVLLFVRGKTEDDWLLQCSVDWVFNRPALIFVLGVYSLDWVFQCCSKRQIFWTEGS